MKRLVWIAVLAVALAGCASEPQTRGTRVKPGQAFDGARLAIKAPPSDGWLLLGRSEGAVVFGQQGPQAAESTIASVSDFPLPADATGERFTALVRGQLAREADPSRFDLKALSIEPTTERPYDCVRMHSLAVDRRALGSVDPLLLEIVGLYCRYPTGPSGGFAVTYSHRGTQRDPSLPAISAGFIQGVQLRAP